MVQGRRRGAIAAFIVAAMLPVAVGATATPVAAAAAPCKVVNVRTGVATNRLQVALDAAAANDTLRITGVCSGSFSIGDGYAADRRLTLRKGATAATLRGNGGRVVAVESGTISIVGIRITGGKGYDCPSGDSADGCGGGIWNAGALTLTGMTVDGNDSTGAGVTMHDGGGIYNAPTGTLHLVRSTVKGNTAPEGAGIYNALGGHVRILRSTVSANTATYPVLANARGGGIYNAGVLTIDLSTISGNTATSPVEATGGGIWSGGPSSSITLVRSTVAGNTVGGAAAVSGGGVYLTDASPATITRSTISGNRATDNGQGGGISVDATSLDIIASTISGNVAGLQYGGIAAGGPLTLLSSTVTANRAPIVGGVAASGLFALQSTILAGNRSTNIDDPDEDCSAFPGNTSGDHSIIGVAVAGHCGNFTDGADGTKVGTAAKPVNPKLGPLASNGGPTRTHALLAGSPAIGAGGPKPCAATTDQRGVARPKPTGSRCDIGAYERS
ncbi:MAG: choice-of-anchor Q domain-containing protein [Chloroflexota bacterium]